MFEADEADADTPASQPSAASVNRVGAGDGGRPRGSYDDFLSYGAHDDPYSPDARELDDPNNTSLSYSAPSARSPGDSPMSLLLVGARDLRTAKLQRLAGRFLAHAAGMERAPRVRRSVVRNSDALGSAAREEDPVPVEVRSSPRATMAPVASTGQRTATDVGGAASAATSAASSLSDWIEARRGLRSDLDGKL